MVALAWSRNPVAQSSANEGSPSTRRRLKRGSDIGSIRYTHAVVPAPRFYPAAAVRVNSSLHTHPFSTISCVPHAIVGCDRAFSYACLCRSNLYRERCDLPRGGSG